MPFHLAIRSRIIDVRKKSRTYHLAPKISRQRRLGFTLIELLVVIAIIGILTSFVTFAFTDSQKKSRDSRRKSDLDAIKKALILAKQDTAGSYSFPKCYAAATASCSLIEPDTSHADDDRETSQPLSPTYIKAIPQDPKMNTGYTYNTFDSTGVACSTTGQCTSFTLVACLENTKDSQKDGTDTCTATDTTSYTITSN